MGSRLPYATLAHDLYHLGLDPVTMLMESEKTTLYKRGSLNTDQQKRIRSSTAHVQPADQRGHEDFALLRRHLGPCRLLYH